MHMQVHKGFNIYILTDSYHSTSYYLKVKGNNNAFIVTLQLESLYAFD